MVLMPRKISTPAIVEAAGTKTKIIEEYFGRVNSSTDQISIARMQSPQGWIEPGQKPEFDEYTVVLKGSLRIRSRDSEMVVREGEAVLVEAGEWVQYSTPDAGAEYIAVCLPAFAPNLANRDAD